MRNVLNNKDFYVYGLFEPLEDSSLDNCFYIGKGKDGRMNHHLSEERSRESYNPHKDRKIAKIRENGNEPYAKKIICGLKEKRALEIEERLIKEIGFNNLTNLLKKDFPVSGSNNPIFGKTGKDAPMYGKSHSESVKKKLSQKLSGSKNPTSKLKQEEVKEIKWLINNTNLIQREIGKRYDVNQARISSIKRGDSWSVVQEMKRPKWYNNFVRKNVKSREKDRKKSRRSSISKLTKEQVSEVKWLLKETTAPKDVIAKKYNVSRSVVYGIMYENVWKDVTKDKKPNWFGSEDRDYFQKIKEKKKEEEKKNISDGVKGENHPNSKLTEEKVSEIKWLLNNSSLTYREISKKYSISSSMISEIKTGKYWGFVIENKKPRWFN